MIKAVLAAADPESIEMTLTITMPLKDWKALRKQLQDGYPAWKLGSMITSATLKAQEHFEERGELDP